MVPLSAATHQRLRLVFRDSITQAVAEEIIETECSDNLPLAEQATPASLERIRFAALKLSGGTLQGLYDAMALARTDWRDLLVIAGFGDEAHAHEKWEPGRQ